MHVYILMRQDHFDDCVYEVWDSRDPAEERRDTLALIMPHYGWYVIKREVKTNG